MSRFLYKLFYTILYFQGNDTPVMVVLTGKLTIIEEFQNSLFATDVIAAMLEDH